MRPACIGRFGMIALLALALGLVVDGGSAASAGGPGLESVLRLRGGSSSFRPGAWGSPQQQPKTSTEELKKNVQQLLEKHASGVMGRDLRRLYKEVTGNDLPLGEFGVQRPIELVEKELTDTVYYTRELDGDVKYFLKKKSTEAGPRPLWQLTCHGDDNCQSVISGDTSFEELKLQAYWGIWSGQTTEQIERTESDLIQQAKARVDAHQAAKNAPLPNQPVAPSPTKPDTNANPFGNAGANVFGGNTGANVFANPFANTGQNNAFSAQQQQQQQQQQQMSQTNQLVSSSNVPGQAMTLFGTPAAPAQQNAASFAQPSLFGQRPASVQPGGGSSLFGQQQAPPGPAAGGNGLFGDSRGNPLAGNSLFGGSNLFGGGGGGAAGQLGGVGSAQVAGGGNSLFGGGASSVSQSTANGHGGALVPAGASSFMGMPQKSDAPGQGLFGGGNSLLARDPSQQSQPGLFGQQTQQPPQQQQQQGLFGGLSTTSQSISQPQDNQRAGLFGGAQGSSQTSTLFGTGSTSGPAGGNLFGGGLFGGSSGTGLSSVGGNNALQQAPPPPQQLAQPSPPSGGVSWGQNQNLFGAAPASPANNAFGQAANSPQQAAFGQQPQQQMQQQQGLFGQTTAPQNNLFSHNKPGESSPWGR